ncbi:hypothetical protein [Alloacidobacterium dinghuense]|nr:hypothetical protein [Alloacidobacterium dinghuense]
MVKGSDLLVAALENEGVDRIFEVPVDYSENKRVLVMSWRSGCP